MTRALKDAGIGPDKVDYINTHGTSTPLGDTAELKAIINIFGENAYKMNISATKSMTGHLLGAAGAVEAMATILAVRDDTVPPTINHHTADPEIDPRLNLTLNGMQKRKVNVAVSNTFGFGGHNAAVVIRKYEA
jgi:3-oxoacyl-[acyl-carrier-protein] synthase II